MEDFEKLGVFYLGREYDLQIKAPRDDLLLYDSKDLVIHGVCVGMTGSGKTRLSIGLVDEAALDGVPGIVIDPKCDLADLMPTFPDLRPEDLRPWINEEGLADWGESGDRIRRLCEAADFAIYTAGSSAGLPISILASFAGPRPHATFPSFSETGSPLECPPPVVPLRMRVLKRPIGGRERTRTMPKGRKHTPEQIVRHLRDAEAGLTAGRTVGQISVSPSTLRPP